MLGILGIHIQIDFLFSLSKVIRVLVQDICKEDDKCELWPFKRKKVVCLFVLRKRKKKSNINIV